LFSKRTRLIVVNFYSTGAEIRDSRIGSIPKNLTTYIPEASFFKKNRRHELAPTREVGAYARSWRLCATLRRRQLFRRRKNLFKKLASVARRELFL
jgi:hypothetical protein